MRRDQDIDDDDDLPDDDDGPAAIGGSARRPLGRNEFPDRSDMTSADDDGTDPCPYCGAPVYVDGEWCPKCGKYLSDEDAPTTKSNWIVIVASLVLTAILLAVLLGR